jgi:predicted metal-dependent HD superfamily phosphohydrolase
MIKNLIISTKSQKVILNENLDNSYLLDIDLSILGSDWSSYQKYILNIRKEYAVYPNFIYKKGRKKVLQNFLDRETLYFTESFQSKFETQARQNILKEIELL